MSGELQVHGLGKAYRVWGSEWLRMASLFGLPARPRDEHWVLRNVFFSISAGESVGIIGQNGAGKSTLLKMITGTTQPSEGSVRRSGRIAAILELGMGFNPDLSGRENAYHAAGLMGYSQAEIEKMMPHIESFAEIGEYFDQPIRTYSSGMQMRVAFSVATAERPDMLIVDEALSVGDAYFVHKSFQRIRDYRESGTTLLIVSHDAAAIQSMCDRAILLDNGGVVLDGEPQQVLDYYNALIAERENKTLRTERRDDKIATESGTGEAQFESLQMLDDQGRPAEYLLVGQKATLRARVRIDDEVPRLVFGYMLRDRLGQAIYGTNTHYTDQPMAALKRGDRVEFDVGFEVNLGPGTYSVSVALSSSESHLVKNYQWKDLALVFTVANADKPNFIGTAFIPSVIRINRIERSVALDA